MVGKHSRRDFLRRVAAAGSVAPFAELLLAQQTHAWPSERLRIGVIGVAGRGAENLAAMGSEEVIALADVDLSRVGDAKTAFPKAAVYQDFQKLLDRNDLDAIVVSTPDHTHAIPTVQALRSGLHVYCEKPLTRSVHEARVVRQTAVDFKSITQMGTQIHAGVNYHRVAAMIQQNVIGPVRRVHVWCARRPEAGVRAKEGVPPASLDYDLWLGPAPMRPYHASHSHFHWRWWWDFGGGVLADMGCHYIDLPFWALNLGAPVEVVAKGAKDYVGDNEVPGWLQVDYQFEARGEQPPVHLSWAHGMPKFPEAERTGMSSGVLFIGDDGELAADYGRFKLYPEERFASFQPPDVETPIGHHQEWLQAIRSGSNPSCHFGYAGPLTEAVLLGNLSYRAGSKLVWDGEAGQVTNSVSGIDTLLAPPYRAGWEL